MALTAQQPLNITELKPLIGKQINWTWLLQRAPIVILSVESAANVFGYLKLTNTHEIISWVGAGGFDAVFVGMVALSDQIRELEVDEAGKIKKGQTDYLFWSINLGALVSSFAFGLLYHSGGSYSAVTPESFTRALVFPFLSLLYTLYFDRKVKMIKVQREKVLRDYPLACEYCSKRFKAGEQKKLNGHLAQCDARKQQKAAKP